ncbi:hypothetical protein SSBR45G_64940 [Bradyrhizobium sp. SSBR45G]|nr:hypothetical protein SSBR45G_64940 [Bradyrhizobium sp. SSBR45G]GLH89009.1 hypothetical protein SSBR45R_64700 [Bradyrhizobium sp. SSBR45R]
MLATAWLGIPYTYSAESVDAAPTLEAVRDRIPVLQAWLHDTRLDNTIEVIRPRRGPHPAQDQVSVIHLLTRWKLPIRSRDDALVDFSRFAGDFLRTSGHSLQHKLLLKFSQLCAVPLREAVVHINVVDTDIAAYIAADGRPATHVGVQHMARANVTIPAEPPSAIWRGNQLPNSDKIMDFLDQRFAARKARFVRDPVFPGIVPFRVDRLRGEIVTDSKMWEKIEGTLFMNQEGDRILLFLEIGGQYAAAGLGDTPPSSDAFRDLEPRYAKQLAEYSTLLLQELQGRFTELVK